VAHNFFTKDLLRWNKYDNDRVMPWKYEKDPYKIWLSEIILQQTRVEQGLAYYYKFVKKYPTIKKLAAAPHKEVFKLWEGLGYYSRCKNLIATAENISNELGGVFPNTYNDILNLKGVGPYTASAISSFAYNLPHAVVDGNVYRVLARYFGIETPVDSAKGKDQFALLAQQLLDKKQPGFYNQAIMDFGATICKPQQPLCSVCVLNSKCVAFNKNKIYAYPVKQLKAIKKSRWFYFIIAEYKDQVLVKKRTDKDIWQNLHQFILIEANAALPPDTLVKQDEFKKIIKDFKVTNISKTYKQQLTHQTIHGNFIHVAMPKKAALRGYEWIYKADLKKIAFPRFITRYFDDMSI